MDTSEIHLTAVESDQQLEISLEQCIAIVRDAVAEALSGDLSEDEREALAVYANLKAV